MFGNNPIRLSVLVQIAIARTIKNNVPAEGMVSMMTVTEKQFAGIDYMVGSFETDIIDSDSRFIEL